MSSNIVLILVLVIGILDFLKLKKFEEYLAVVGFAIVASFILYLFKDVDLATMQAIYLLGVFFMMKTDPADKGRQTPWLHAIIGLIFYFLVFLNAFYIIYTKL
jgi:uncharacterized membrane protein YjjP (DUF1212 family)